MSESNAPYVTLGRHLKYVREQSDQSLAEVSGAVEIDERSLARIEAGQERPTEDILLLLISHFSMPEHEALQLWELAEYEGDVPDQIKPEADGRNDGKAVVMLLAFDSRAIYSDGLEVAANKAGLTLSFTQATTQSPTPVARVGMSLEQAEQALYTLQQAILQAKHLHTPKRLPPKSSKSQSN